MTLSGEVQFPGTYTARKGERLSSVVARAGGFTKDAYLKAAQFTRVSTQKTQQEAIDKLIDDLELEVAQKGAAGERRHRQGGRGGEQGAARGPPRPHRPAEENEGQGPRHHPTWRTPARSKGTLGDVLLEDGDRLDVPKKMNVVNVVGRVYNPTGVVYDPARDTVGYYLRWWAAPRRARTATTSSS